jgi:anti-sigma factor RsiW
MTNVFRSVRYRRDRRWAPRRMPAYLDDELPTRARTRLERHARDCQECRWVLGTLRRMLGPLERTPPASTTEETLDIASAVRARLHERGER